MKQRRLKLAFGTLSVAVCIIVGIWLHQAKQRSQMERKADELIVAKTDELLLRLVRADETLQARFGPFQSMERRPFYADPWFTRMQVFDINCIDFARLARFARGEVRITVNIGYAANPELGRRSVRIDTWRLFQALDGATHTPIVCLNVRPILGEPDASSQSNPPRFE